MTDGEDVRRLECEIAKRFDVKHAICVPMARVGIHLAVKALIKPGQNVIMSPYTIADVVNMVIAAGGRPVFADIERESCNIDPAQVSRLIDQQSGAVLVTHLHGIAARTDEIRDICRSRDVPLIEDAAQAFGAIDNGRRVGTLGDAGVYSFGMYKNINTWYGGAVVTGRDDIAAAVHAHVNQWPYQAARFILKRMRKGLATDLATHPLLFKALTFWVFRYGCLHDVEWINRMVRTELDTGRRDALRPHYLARLTPSQARIAIPQLEYVDSYSHARIERARLYDEALKALPSLITPPGPDGLKNIYTYYPVQCERRDEVVKTLMRRNCDIAPQHLKNCADLDSFTEFRRDCPNARAAASSVLLLATYPRYPISITSRNIATLRAIMTDTSAVAPVVANAT